jgi:signal-transduction protein with cAMP-binding, CBS, and nucleotidyltransferase domain
MGSGHKQNPARQVEESPFTSAQMRCIVWLKAHVRESAVALITDRRIRHLPVVWKGRLEGLISIGDLVKYKTKSRPFRSSSWRSTSRPGNRRGSGGDQRPGTP